MRIIAPGCTGVAISVSGIVGIVRMVLVMIVENVEKFGDRRGRNTSSRNTRRISTDGSRSNERRSWPGTTAA